MFANNFWMNFTYPNKFTYLNTSQVYQKRRCSDNRGCTVSLLFLQFWTLCTHARTIKVNPFYHPFYPDVTHVRKISGPLQLFRTVSNEKLGWAWERGYVSPASCYERSEAS